MSVVKIWKKCYTHELKTSPLLRSNAMNLATAMRQKPILVCALIEATSMMTMTRRSEPVTQRWFCTWGRSTLSGSSFSSFKLSIVAISCTLMGFWYRVPRAEIGQFRETEISCQWSSSASLKHTLDAKVVRCNMTELQGIIRGSRPIKPSAARRSHANGVF